MNTEMDRSYSSRKFVVLAPSDAAIPDSFGPVLDDVSEHADLISRMQQLRGRIYLEDGAITTSHLDSEGRHYMSGDHDSWHLLRLREDGSVSGCARILVHPGNVSYPELRVASSALAKCPTWGGALRATMESDIANAREAGHSVIEPGGWALAEDLRCSTEALSIAVGALAWSQLFGGCVGYMTATVRHGSSSILRRLGSAEVKIEGRRDSAYFDPAYGCEMELLRFHSQCLNPRFSTILDKTRRLLVGAPVIVGRASASVRLAA